MTSSAPEFHGRSRESAGAALAAAVAVTMGLAASCGSLPRARPAATPRPPAPGRPAAVTVESLVASPRIRVGILTEASRVSIGADSGLLLRGLGPAGETREATVQRATFVPLFAASAPGRFRVQVASLTDPAAAREIAARARQVSGLEPTVRFSEETRTHQVRLGDFPSREEAQALAARLTAAGLEGVWVAQELMAGAAGRVRLLETGEELGPVTLLPAMGEETLTVDGLPYRGVLQVQPNEAGSLTVVNILNLEDYLRGVVPNELSPQAFPQLEAIKAQAVAARTYALRNRGQFEAKGYDICATPACQVYRGRSSEHPLSDQAVQETRGLAATHGGSLINALYTSTCGGHTEDVTNIFEGEDAPYLRGVICAPERAAWASLRTSAAPLAPGNEEGLTRDIALLASLGILDPHPVTDAALKGRPTDDELRSWMLRLLTALRRQGCESDAEPPLGRRASFFRHLTASLCWDERARRLLAPHDADYLLQVEDREELAGEGERLAAALLIGEGIVSPFSDNTLRANAPLTRAQVFAVLARTAIRAGAPGLLSAEFRGASEGAVELKQGDATESYPLEPAFHLFRALDGSPLAVSELSLAAGEKVQFVLQDGRITYLQAEQSRLGASADRTSRVYRWEVRMTPAEVAKAVARYGSVGEVRDLVPLRIGVSGRVVELAVNGSEGELVLKGLKVRWGLGLRENLFVIDREREPSGAVERFVFTGKGWGHGVGLCQVGAFGMAQAGATFERILRHYYSGISLEKAY